MSTLNAASSSTTPADTHAGPRHTRAFVALILGGVGIGVAEFVTMGVLPQIATGLDISIPTAGYAISAYALGVVVGAPVAAVGAARAPRRAVLVGFMLLFAVANAAAALAPSLEALVLARFAAGLPHAGFFGLASLVAVSLAAPGRGGRAVGRVMLGIPIALLLGVPLGTWAGQVFGWRVSYWAVAVIGLLAAVLVHVWVPSTPRDPTQSRRVELRAFGSRQFWLTLAIGAIGFGGMFATYSYIAPTVTEVTGLAQGWVPVFLLTYGVVSIVGTWLGGRLGDWSVLRTLVLTGVGSAASLLVFYWSSGSTVPALLTVAAIGLTSSAWVIGLQLRLMQVAGSARTIGAAMNHASLNVANALGAWVGGLVIAAGYGFRAPALVGAALSVGGLLVLGISLLVHRHDVGRGPAGMSSRHHS
ncbi:MFS transporter [Serinicoccus kebangsaanensis]|uniref:MFS transporter n=1 Tax=Serinicoccus kebangsaanensis TaxID=2602069 RepID=UPI001EE25A0F|nr:MFS transporter [Serinicoccus kebangsaanensis]